MENGEDGFEYIDNIDQYLKIEPQLISHDAFIDPFVTNVDQNLTLKECNR